PLKPRHPPRPPLFPYTTLFRSEEAAWFRARLRDAARPPADRSFIARRALQRRYLLIYRTLAEPRHLDLSLDPSERRPGSIFSFRSEEHTSELQSRFDLVCRLLL